MHVANDLGELVATLMLAAPAILTADVTSDILDVSKRVPDAYCDALIFEATLGRARPQVAVSLGLDRGGFAWLVESDRWPTVANACRRVSERSDADPLTWLEFDTDLPNGGASCPSIYVGAYVRSDARLALGALVRQLSHDPAATAEPTERCFAALPPSVSRVYVGAMSRGAGSVRINLDAFASDDLLRYLAAVGWRGPLDAVAAYLARLNARFGRYCVQLDLGGGEILPNVGIEIVRDAAQYPDDRDVTTLLATLVEDGYCEVEEARRIATWPSRRPSGLELVFAALRPADHPSTSVVRTIHHIKVSFDANARVTAKAYLAAIRRNAA